MGVIKDITGQKFGKLTVLRLATPEERGKYKNRHAIWYCQCDCGNMRFISGTDLRSGKQVSCGCQKKQRIIEQNKNNFRDLTNQTFGFLTALYPLHKRAELSGSYIWHCKCHCGKEIDVIGARLTGGYTSSCGCSYHRRKSQYSEKIKQLLLDNNILFKEEYLIHYDQNNMSKNFGFLDFYLPFYNIGLEVQGQQHYDTTHPWYRPEYDQKKKEYCQKAGIKLIEIPYYDINQYSLQYLCEKMEIEI